MEVPYFRPMIGEPEIQEVLDVLHSGWLTTGPRVKRFETLFAEATGGRYAVALNSATAALHLALEALNVSPKDRILVPTMTFAATAEVVRYLQAEPVLVDCDPETLLMDLNDARAKLESMHTDSHKDAPCVGMIPVHVAGLMMDMEHVLELARQFGLWVVEDAAHSFPSAWRPSDDAAWRRCGSGDSDVACFSFYANKTITTGEGGMAMTQREDLADRMRIMSLHGISKDAWKRYTASGNWYYEIVAPGFKYNLTDIAAAIGIHQLARAEAMRLERENIAQFYLDSLKEFEEIELPPIRPNRIHSWHLFYLRLRLEKLSVDRAFFIEEMKKRGVSCSVHWMPLHLHPYYRDRYGYTQEDFPNASAVWPRLVSLPIFPGMTADEVSYVASCIKEICTKFSR